MLRTFALFGAMIRAKFLVLLVLDLEQVVLIDGACPSGTH
uniref:Uncharacterized protein n=1 Tax=Rhizophora mucronata TaxID=61149 RepID=A0A2P2NMX3_RHIMU